MGSLQVIRKNITTVAEKMLKKRNNDIGAHTRYPSEGGNVPRPSKFRTQERWPHSERTQGAIGIKAECMKGGISGWGGGARLSHTAVGGWIAVGKT